MPAPDFWPRLYLDTGDLLAIADENVAPELVQDLRAACNDHLVLLVVSYAHLQDTLQAADATTVDRFIAALERFRFRCWATRGPEVVEPWADLDAPEDIEIEGCSNIREVLLHHVADPLFATMRELQDAIYRAALTTNALAKVTEKARIPRHHRPIALESMITQICGWRGDDPEPIVRHHLSLAGGTPTCQEIDRLILAQVSIAALMREVRPTLEANGVDRIDLMKKAVFSIANDGFKRAPGAWLSGKHCAGLWSESSRPPMRSDPIDCLHARYLPYVDIASCDAQSHKILSRYIGQVRGPRSRTVALFRNGRIADIVAYIRTLPTGIELYERRVEVGSR